MTHPAPLKISVVTAVYNRVATVAEAMESVQSQTYPHIEHIIQDGASTDGTVEALRRFEGPNVLIESVRDAGIYDAINKGITRASGDVIGLMHSDDFFASNSVLADVASAFEDLSVDGVYGDLDYVAAGDTSKVIRHWVSGEYAPKKLRQGWMPPHPTLYLRRSVFDKWGTYDTSFQIAADYDAMLRYLATGGIKLAYLPDVMVKMRVGGESNRSLSRILRKSREDYRALKANRVGGLAALALKNVSKLQQFF